MVIFKIFFHNLALIKILLINFSNSIIIRAKELQQNVYRRCPYQKRKSKRHNLYHIPHHYFSLYFHTYLFHCKIQNIIIWRRKKCYQLFKNLNGKPGKGCLRVKCCCLKKNMIKVAILFPLIKLNKNQSSLSFMYFIVFNHGNKMSKKLK